MRLWKWCAMIALAGPFALSVGCDKRDEVETEVITPAEEGAAVVVPETRPVVDNEPLPPATEVAQGEGEMQMADAAVVLRNQEKEPVGAVLFRKTGTGVQIDGRATQLEAGAHGFHVHQNGVCDPPDFKSAGGHFNPAGSPHGGPTHASEKRHVGDFGNIKIEANGVGHYDRVDKAILLDEGPSSIVGKAMIIHAKADDLESQPSGAAGDRVACGVITTDASEIKAAMALAMDKGAAGAAVDPAPTTQPIE